MASNHNFRSAFNGFNREDVVQYIEHINTKHTCAINQLNSEKQALVDEINQLRNHGELNTKIAELEAANAELAEKCAALETQLAEQQAAPAPVPEVQSAPRSIAEEELEAYRRAERAERAAKERAEQIYQQANGTLAQATTQVDEAALRFKAVAEEMNAHMAQLQQSVESSKNALLEAATTLYAIRPEAEEE